MLMVLGFAAPAFAEDCASQIVKNMRLSYDAYVFGLHTGSFDVDVRWHVDPRAPSDVACTYDVVISAETVGIFKYAYDFQSKITGAGKVVRQANTWRHLPASYGNEASAKKESRRIQVTYDAQGPLQWNYRNDPRRDRESYFQERVLHSSDFASGFVELLASANARPYGQCHGEWRRMFDGRRVYSMQFHAESLPKSRPNSSRHMDYKGEVSYCKAVITERFDMRKDHHKTYPNQGLVSEFIFATPVGADDLPLVPIQMRIGTPGADALAYLQAISLIP